MLDNDDNAFILDVASNFRRGGDMYQRLLFGGAGVGCAVCLLQWP